MFPRGGFSPLWFFPRLPPFLVACVCWQGSHLTRNLPILSLFHLFICYCAREWLRYHLIMYPITHTHTLPSPPTSTWVLTPPPPNNFEKEKKTCPLGSSSTQNIVTETDTSQNTSQSKTILLSPHMLSCSSRSHSPKNNRGKTGLPWKLLEGDDYHTPSWGKTLSNSSRLGAATEWNSLRKQPDPFVSLVLACFRWKAPLALDWLYVHLAALEYIFGNRLGERRWERSGVHCCWGCRLVIALVPITCS